jgi:hypothetical protein
MGQTECMEIIIRGDLMLRQIIMKFGEQLMASDLDADFSSTIVIPPFRMAMNLQYPSLGVLHVRIEAKDIFRFERMLRDLLDKEHIEIISIGQLGKR